MPIKLWLVKGTVPVLESRLRSTHASKYTLGRIKDFCFVTRICLWSKVKRSIHKTIFFFLKKWTYLQSVWQAIC